MFYQKRDSFCQGCHFDSNRSIHIFSFLSFFELVEIGKVKKEINNTCRNCKSERIV